MEEGIKILWGLLQSASPIAAAVCFLAMLKAWRDLQDERTERQTLQKQKDELLERTLKGLNDSATAINANTTVATSTKNSIYALRDALSPTPLVRSGVTHD